MDYQKIGFKCGIEIHQQLDTKKLFCGCMSNITDVKPDFTITRYLRASAGETGEIDIAAKHEADKAKQFIYNCYHDATCLVELDEEPPHPMNREALEIGIIIAKLLNAKIVDEIQVMRKTVVDGSNTTGFQRTALIARDGYIDTSKGKVLIPTICIEEEAAKIVERKKEHDTYNLSRLGIPLIELGTDASIKDPEHAKEVASALGMLLRSSKVKRGLGTIRQDVNLSVTGGSRVEIKGFQDIKSIPKIIDNELKRQLALIEKGKPVPKEVRKAEADLTTSFLRPMPGAARMYPETDIKPISTAGIKVELPVLLSEKSTDLKAMGIPDEIASTLVKTKEFDLFMRYAKRYRNIEPKFIASTLIQTPK
jgi:glutamyl-tRNA(Gln) amidotransferase subunit E